MNRFEYAQAVLRDDEVYVSKHKSVKIYHGDQKVKENNNRFEHTVCHVKNN